MYKVLIVDDEKEIREGLAGWSWETVGLQAAGCCSHGLEALQFISEHAVDIVMTDIRMPFMDGIELMETLNRQYPFISVVILSGYSDFDYAQKAIRNGAADYLLKPVQFSVLERSMKELVHRFEERKQTEYRISVLKRKAEMLSHLLREDFLCRLFQYEMTEEDIEQGCSEGEVLLNGLSFTVALYRLNRLASPNLRISERELRLLTFSLDNILRDLWDRKGFGYHVVDKRTAEFCLLSVHPEANQEFTAIVRQLEKYVGLFRSTFSVGIGQTVRQPSEIHQSFRSAEQALRKHHETSLASFDHQPHLSIAAPPASDTRQGSPNVPAGNGNQNSILLVKAKKYIQNHYHRSLTLKEVADHVYVSPGYLSALFKEAGETYLKYLTSLRMQKAMELLSETNIKVYEVVEMVGYSDPAYFSELFKKHTGKLPNEFRGKSKQREERS
jgi:two-component system response regulator YesN